MFRRLGNLIRGFFGLFISGLERQNPEALLEVEKENLRTQIANYNKGLAAHAGLCEKLMSQVKKLDGEERDLKAKVTAALRMNNREKAGQYALRLQTIQRELGDNRRQAEEADKTYKELIRARDVSIRAAQKKIEDLKMGLDDLKIKRATAELNEMASGMISEIGGAGDTLNRLHEMVEEERTKAAGRARVAKDAMDMGDVAVKEEEEKAMAEMALADFAAQEGIALQPSAASVSSSPAEASPSTEPAPRQMGPQTQ
jgi:phage shock protein A